MPEMRNLPARLQPPTLYNPRQLHLNIVIASMTLGGAERIVYDIASALDVGPFSVNLFVMNETEPCYPVDALQNVRVIFPRSGDRAARFSRVASEVLASPNPTVFTHLLRMPDVEMLLGRGIKVLPVIHNSARGWHEPASAYAQSSVPAFIAVCSSVKAQLNRAGLTKPVVVLRHELPARDPLEADSQLRDELRCRHNVRDGVCLIGMVGQFKSHKAYVRAVRVLAKVRARRNAKLIILGGWDHDYGAGRTAYIAAMQTACDLGVLPDLICTGPMSDARRYYNAFDVFLNTSIYEGLSIATLEAVRAGCPVVSADVGGQQEAVGTDDSLIGDPADIDAYVDAIEAQVARPRPTPPGPLPAPDLIPRLWLLLGEYGTMTPRSGLGTVETIFVTSNLNPGGPQRSLTNLLVSLAGKHRSVLCVLENVLGEGFVSQLEACTVPSVSLSGAGGQLNRVAGVLDLIKRLGARTVCFWNADPSLKLLVAKVLENAAVRIVDVSPGPILFSELEQSANLQRRIAFTAEDYMRRLDVFVSKYRAETSHPWAGLARRSAVIPNGVRMARQSQSANAMISASLVDPMFAMVTTCRIAPAKRLEWVVRMMKELSQRNAAATLAIVGGVDQRHLGYWQLVLDLIAAEGLRNIHFLGPSSDIFSILPQFRLFVMVSRDQGCPNASLEAMACGLPVVANSDGGTAEQVVNGRTGYLVKSDDPADMAAGIANLFQHPELIARFGEAGRARVRKLFSLEKMANSYLDILAR